LGFSFSKTRNEIKTQVENKTQGKKRKKERRLTWFVWEPPLQLEGGFGTQFWLGLVNTQTFVMMHLNICFFFLVLVRSSKYTNVSNDVINYMFFFSVLHDLARSFNFVLDRDIQ
jgi:hypothetical protein